MQADIQVAYLSAELDEEIYIRPPDGVKRLPPGYVNRLRRSMYGLPQAGRNFNRHFNDKLLAAGVKQLQEDSCLYVRKNKGQVTIVAIYVDYIFVGGSTNV